MNTHIKNPFLLPVLITGLGLLLAAPVTAQTFTALHSFTVALPPGRGSQGMSEPLETLAAHDKTKAELVKLLYFVGLTIPEAASILGLSEPTAKRYWSYSRAWLFAAIEAAR